MRRGFAEHVPRILSVWPKSEVLFLLNDFRTHHLGCLQKLLL